MNKARVCFCSALFVIVAAAVSCNNTEPNTTATTKKQWTDSFITINNANIFYAVRGSSIPALVFVSGFGEDNQTWQQVEDSIAGVALTFSYSRAGLGKSSYSGQEKNASAIVAELKALVDSINIPKPFIIVGHSLGCNIEKIYAATYADDVRGLIFIDPGYNEEILQKAISLQLWQQREDALKKYIPALNIAQQAEKKELNNIVRCSDSIHQLPNVPITLFTATLTNPSFPASAQELIIKQASHANWLQFLPQAKHIIVPTSRHYVQNDNPELVINAIRDMLKLLNSNQAK